MLDKNKVICILIFITIIIFSFDAEANSLENYLEDIIKQGTLTEVEGIIDIPYEDLVLESPAPFYPKESIGTDDRGKVLVVADVGADGLLEDTKILRPSNIDYMNRNSRNIINHEWEFKEYNTPYKIFIKFEFKHDLLGEPTVRKDFIEYDDMENLLFKAVTYNDYPEVLKTLLDAGVYIDAVDEKGRTPLIIASKLRENFRMVEILLEHGATVNTWDEEKVTPLMYAAANNNAKIVKLLLKYGAHLDIEGAKVNTLSYAVKNDGRINTVKQLLDRGADVNIKDNDGYIPLKYAIDNKNLEMIELLIEYGADVNHRVEEERTLFMEAVSLIEDKRIIKKFIEEDSNIIARDENGITPLMFAAGNNKNTDIIDLLLQKEETNISRRSKDGYTAFAYSVYNRNPEIPRKLIESGAEINIRNDHELTPLMEAVLFGEKETVEILLKAGANVNVKEEDGMTPLMFAIDDSFLLFDIEPRTDVAKMLIDFGADINLKDKKGRTALMHAVNNKKPDLHFIELLLEEGAKINKIDEEGKTPLMYAAQDTQNPAVIDLLLDEGADGKIKCDEEKTAFDYAEGNEHLEGTDEYWRLNDAQYD